MLKITCVLLQHRGAEQSTGDPHAAAPPAGEQHRECGGDLQHFTGEDPGPC